MMHDDFARSHTPKESLFYPYCTYCVAENCIFAGPPRNNHGLEWNGLHATFGGSEELQTSLGTLDGVR